MAKGIWVGVNGVPRKVKAIYVGVNNAAKKVKKGFVGIGNAAKVFFSGAGAAYHGTAEDIQENRFSGFFAGATANNKLAVFSGFDGQAGTSSLNYTHVSKYDTALVRTTGSLGTKRASCTGASNGEYALLAGGEFISNSTNYEKRVQYYDENGTRGEIDDTVATSIMDCRGCSLPEHGLAIFAGGARANGSYNDSVNTMAVIDENLTLIDDNMSSERKAHGGVAFTKYAVFCGGVDSTRSSSINVGTSEAFDNNLVSRKLSDIDPAGSVYTQGANSGCAFFVSNVAPSSGSTSTRYMFLFDENLTYRRVVSQFPVGIVTSSIDIGDSTLVVGCDDSADAWTVDANGVVSGCDPCSAKGETQAAARTGKYALFAGDNNNGTKVEVYEIEGWK